MVQVSWVTPILLVAVALLLWRRSFLNGPATQWMMLSQARMLLDNMRSDAILKGTPNYDHGGTYRMPVHGVDNTATATEGLKAWAPNDQRLDGFSDVPLTVPAHYAHYGAPAPPPPPTSWIPAVPMTGHAYRLGDNDMTLRKPAAGSFVPRV